MTIENSLQGKVAVITGGSSGIGFATASRLAASGVSVFIFGRRQEEIDRAAASIDGEVYGVAGDVANIDDLDRLYATVAQKKGVVDIVFANAATICFQTIDGITERALDHQIDVNLKGVIYTIQKALPLLRTGGSIVLTSSIGAQKGIASQGVYHACKAALRSLVRTWIVELKDRGIRVNLVTPGAVDTPAMKGMFPDPATRDAVLEQITETSPAGRLGRAEELAEVVAFLASDAASYINGSDVQVDGGSGQI